MVKRTRVGATKPRHRAKAKAPTGIRATILPGHGPGDTVVIDALFNAFAHNLARKLADRQPPRSMERASGAPAKGEGP